MVLVWQITDDSPNSPTFPPAKVSMHTVQEVIVYLYHLANQLIADPYWNM